MTKETKRNNFKRLAETRTRKVLQYLTLLSNLSNKQYYDYSEADYKKISKAIREQLNDMDKKFSIAITKVEKFRL